MANPHLRQTSSLPPRFTATLEWGTGYEALLALSMFTGDERQDSYEVGRAWFTRARAAASRQLVAALRSLVGGDGPRWFLLLGMVHEAGGAHDLERLTTHIRSSRPEDVLIALVGGRMPALRTDEGRALVNSALAGDASAALRMAERGDAGSPAITRRLIERGARDVKRFALEVIDRFAREVFRPMGDQAEALAADANAKARAAGRMSAQHLVDFATGGVSYEGEAGIDRVLLVPSIVTRPWITISDWDSTKIICYRAGRGTGTAGEPDRDMVLVYRALGDETRLRLLRELAAGDRRLAELAQALGLAKSTLHGHLGVLRSAGLIRITIGAEKKYGLRPGLPDLNRTLAAYLRRGGRSSRPDEP
jgi:DNA-binding transcriptional ArsR family regulator